MIKELSKNKLFLIYQESNQNFHFQIPINSIDKIIKLYGDEKIQFENFIILSEENISSMVTKKETMNKELDDYEANRISEGLNNLGKYYIIPESLKTLDEDKQYEQAIKLKGKYITYIMKKAGIELESMIYYLGVQIISHEENENNIINYFLIEKIFNQIQILSIKFKNKNSNLNISFHSFQQILKNCEINLEKILPFLHKVISDLDRTTINYKEIPIYKALKLKQIKNQLISLEVQNKHIDIMKGTDSLSRIERDDFNDLELFRKNESDFLKELNKEIEEKKEEIKNICENEENQIIELTNNKNEIFYIRKKTYDDLIKNIDNYNNIKIRDINNIVVILNKQFIKESENINNNIKPLIKLYKDNNKDDFIFIYKNDLLNKFNEFKYIKQEEIFIGKDINGKPKQIKELFMKIKCEILSKLNEDLIYVNKINNNELNIDIQNSKEKLKYDKIQKIEIEPEYENFINPYNNIPFKQLIALRKKEIKNEDKKEQKEKVEKIKDKNEQGINFIDKKTYRIRRAILFKKPSVEENKKEKKNC